MKEQEKIFFVLCYHLEGVYTPREIISILNETIPHKRCWYYLEKWAGKDIYSYGTNLELGWFKHFNLPEPYKSLVGAKV